MPRRDDLKRILILGSGPIRIGQAAEFDFSGSQACRALRSDGYEVILVNSNPATIQNDPEMADRIYIEPLLPEVVKRIMESEKPDALLAGMGGQTALNIASALAKDGTLDELGVELIGCNLAAIDEAEDRDLFKKVCEEIDLPVCKALACDSIEEVIAAAEELGSFPLLIRPAFTLGGLGGGTAFNMGELVEIASQGILHSAIGQVLIEESILGWQEHEYEVMRDGSDNAIIVCTMENIDPMGTHTGDSVTIAPALTLTDKEYQVMRNASIACLRKIGVETGGSNVQFAINPKNGRMVVIEMNPRVSRSSALASKATGFPIAKVAAKLAVGYTLDELKNDIEANFLDTKHFDGPQQTLYASKLIKELDCACVLVLGGDGTNRLVAKEVGNVPIIPISTGTNNAFPIMIDPTVAGLAAGFYVNSLQGSNNKELIFQRPIITISIDDKYEDLALIDLAVSNQNFVGSKAIWDPKVLDQLYLTQSNPVSIGLSAIGSKLTEIPQNHALRMQFGKQGEKIYAPIAPGLISEINVSGTIALDGERELEIYKKNKIEITLQKEGPFVLDVIESVNQENKLKA